MFCLSYYLFGPSTVAQHRLAKSDLMAAWFTHVLMYLGIYDIPRYSMMKLTHMKELSHLTCLQLNVPGDMWLIYDTFNIEVLGRATRGYGMSISVCLGLRRLIRTWPRLKTLEKRRHKKRKRQLASCRPNLRILGRLMNK